jgi:hypothetical protein
MSNDKFTCDVCHVKDDKYAIILLDGLNICINCKVELWVESREAASRNEIPLYGQLTVQQFMKRRSLKESEPWK